MTTAAHVATCGDSFHRMLLKLKALWQPCQVCVLHLKYDVTCWPLQEQRFLNMLFLVAMTR